MTMVEQTQRMAIWCLRAIILGFTILPRFEVLRDIVVIILL